MAGVRSAGRPAGGDAMANAVHAKDALETLGTILDDTAGRDAVHVAVEPVVAGDRLSPGQHIGRLSDGTYGIGRDVQPLGIVDPFLRRPVSPGQRFYLFLYPRTITGLRHVWTHPAFLDGEVTR